MTTKSSSRLTAAGIADQRGQQQRTSSDDASDASDFGAYVRITVAEIGQHYGLKCGPKTRSARFTCPVCKTASCRVYYVKGYVGVTCGGDCPAREVYRAIEDSLGRGGINRRSGEGPHAGVDDRYDSISALPPEEYRADCTNWRTMCGTTPNGSIWRSVYCTSNECPGCHANTCWVNAKRIRLGIRKTTGAWIASFDTLKGANRARQLAREAAAEPLAIQVFQTQFLKKPPVLARTTLEESNEDGGFFPETERETHPWCTVTVSDTNPVAAEIIRRDAVVAAKASAAATAAAMAFIADERHRQRQAAGKPTKRSQALSASTADNAARRKDQLGKALARRAALGYWRQIPTDAAVELAGMLPPRWQGEDTGDSAVNAISWGSGETAWWIDIAVPPSRYEASRWKEDPHKSVPGGGAIADNKADKEALKIGTEEAATYYAKLWCAGVTPIPASISQAIMRLLPIRRKKHMIPRELRWELEDLTGYRGPAQLIWDAIRDRAGLMAEREAFEFVPFEGADQQVTDATDDVVDDMGAVSDAVDCEDCDGFGCFVCEYDEPTPAPDTWDMWDGPTVEELDEMRSWFCPDCGMLACVGDCADLYAEPPRQGSRQRRATGIPQAVA